MCDVLGSIGATPTVCSKTLFRLSHSVNPDENSSTPTQTIPQRDRAECLTCMYAHGQNQISSGQTSFDWLIFNNNVVSSYQEELVWTRRNQIFLTIWFGLRKRRQKAEAGFDWDKLVWPENRVWPARHREIRRNRLTTESSRLTGYALNYRFSFLNLYKPSLFTEPRI